MNFIDTYCEECKKMTLHGKCDCVKNYDTTDFPTKPCNNCGKKDRPQYKGSCNDGHCDNYE